jgi:MFS family permease
LLEGAGIDWSVIYMRDLFDETALVNGMALSIGALAQAIARFFADAVVDRHGPFKTARLLILVLGVGTITVVFSPLPWLSLLGFALIGIGTSALFPLSMSAAAQRTDRSAAVNVASVAQLTFIIFLLAPPTLGFIAEHFGIRYSFALGLPLVLLSWVTAHSLISKEE